MQASGLFVWSLVCDWRTRNLRLYSAQCSALVGAGGFSCKGRAKRVLICFGSLRKLATWSPPKMAQP